MHGDASGVGQGHDEAIYKDALEFEFTQKQIAYACEREYRIQYKTTVLPHKYFADFVVLALPRQPDRDEHPERVNEAAKRKPIGVKKA